MKKQADMIEVKGSGYKVDNIEFGTYIPASELKDMQPSEAQKGDYYEGYDEGIKFVKDKLSKMIDLLKEYGLKMQELSEITNKFEELRNELL